MGSVGVARVEWSVAAAVAVVVLPFECHWCLGSQMRRLRVRKNSQESGKWMAFEKISGTSSFALVCLPKARVGLPRHLLLSVHPDVKAATNHSPSRSHLRLRSPCHHYRHHHRRRHHRRGWSHLRVQEDCWLPHCWNEVRWRLPWPQTVIMEDGTFC